MLNFHTALDKMQGKKPPSIVERALRYSGLDTSIFKKNCFKRINFKRIGSDNLLNKPSIELSAIWKPLIQKEPRCIIKLQIGMKIDLFLKLERFTPLPKKKNHTMTLNSGRETHCTFLVSHFPLT